MFILFRIIAAILCLLAMHILLNARRKDLERDYLLLIIGVFFVHNIFIFPIYFTDFNALKIVDDAAPFCIVYGPLLLGYYYILSTGKIAIRSILLHLAPVLLLFTAYYIFVTNAELQQKIALHYFRIVYLLLGISMIGYSVLVLLKAKKQPEVALRVSLFARYCILGGVFLFSVALNGEYHRIKSPQGQNLDALLVAFMLICGSIILLFEAFSQFKRSLGNQVVKADPESALSKDREAKEEDWEEYLSVESFLQSEEIFQIDLDQSKIALRLGLRPEKLEHLIGKYYKSNVQRVLATKRVLLCMKMLALDDKEVNFEALPYQVGFRSKATFYRNFAHLAGCSPKEYRRRALSTNPITTIG